MKKMTMLMTVVLAMGVATVWAGEPAGKELTLHDQVGIGGPTYAPNGKTNEELRDRLDRQFKLIAEMGIKHVRMDGYFSNVWPEPDRMDWSLTDRMVEISEKYGIKLLITLDYGTPWASTAPPERQSPWELRSYPPDLDAYVRWARKYATRYKGRIKDYEIWNEPNGSDLFWKGSPEQYATMMKAAYVAIKAVDPEINVVHSCTSADYAYIKNLFFKLGGDKYSDATVIHPYGVKPDKANYANLLNSARNIDNKCEYPKQFWNTEWGAHCKVTPTLRQIILGFIYGLDRNYQFCLSHVPSYAFIDPPTLKPRLVYYAVKNLMAQIKDLPLRGTVQSANDVMIAAFGKMGKGKASLVIWTTGKARTLSLPELKKPVKIDGTPKVFSNATLSAKRLTPIVRVKKTLPAPVVELAGFIEPPVDKLYFKQDDASEQIIKLRVFNNTPSATNAVVSIKTPSGWKTKPKKISTALKGYESKWLEFKLTPVKAPTKTGNMKGFAVKAKLGKVNLPEERIWVAVTSASNVNFKPGPITADAKGILSLPVKLAHKSGAARSVEMRILPSREVRCNPRKFKARIAPGKSVTLRTEAVLNPNSLEYPFEVGVRLYDGSIWETSNFIPDFSFALKTDKPIVIDGDIKEWRRIPGIFVGRKEQIPTMAYAWEGVKDASYVVKQLWDDKNLYMLFDITDDMVNDNHLGHTAWMSDCIELFLSMNNRQKGSGKKIRFADGDYQILLPALLNPKPGEKRWDDVNHSGVGQAEGLESRGAIKVIETVAKRTQKGFVIEVRIPWSNFPGFKAVPNAEFGFDVAFSDGDASKFRKLQMLWRSGPDACWNVARFGTIRLIEKLGHVSKGEAFVYPLDRKVPVGCYNGKNKTSVETKNVKKGRGALRCELVSGTKGSGLTDIYLSRDPDGAGTMGFVPKQVSVWVYNEFNSKPMGIMFRVSDRYGETFMMRFRTFPEKGKWTHLKLTFGNGIHSWGGDGNKKIDLPLGNLVISFEYGPNTKANLIFDDVRIH